LPCLVAAEDKNSTESFQSHLICTGSSFLPRKHTSNKIVWWNYSCQSEKYRGH